MRTDLTTQYTRTMQPASSPVSSAEQHQFAPLRRQVQDPEQTGQPAKTSTRALPGQDKTKPDGSPRDALELSREAQEIRQLQLREHEVISHEAAHASAGGAHAGSPSYSYEQGPDGRRYVTGGEVSIDISPVKDDPEATLAKAQQVRAAALAPAEPSAQDMKVAQKAQAMASKARVELSREQSAAASTVSTDPVDNPANINASSHPEASQPEGPTQDPTAPGAVPVTGRASLDIRV